MSIFRVPKRLQRGAPNQDVKIVGSKNVPSADGSEPKVYSSSQTRSRATEIHDTKGNKIKVQSHERSRPRRNK